MSSLANDSYPRRRGTQKPRLGTRIDWGHPLANGLLAAIPLIEGAGPPQEIVQASVGTLIGGGSKPVWKSQELAFTANSLAAVAFPYTGNIYTQAGPFTASCEILLNLSGSRNAIVDTRNAGNQGWVIFVTASGQIEFYQNNGGGPIFDLSTTTTYPAGSRLAISMSAGPTSVVGVVTNLSTSVVSTVSGTYAPGLTGGSQLILGDDGGGSRSFGGTMRWFTLHNRPLSDGDIKSLHKEPYALYTGSGLSRYPRITVLPPGIPTGLTATNAPAPVLTWTAGTGSLTTSVLRSTTSGSGYVSIAVGVSGTTYTDATAVPGQIYYYVVRANNSSGTSANSNQATAYTQPTAPVQLAGTSGNGQVTLNAGIPATGGGVITYNVYDGTSVGAEGGVAILAGQTNPATMVVTGLTNGLAYFFFVTASNSAGEGAHSNETGVIPSASAGGRRITQGFA